MQIHPGAFYAFLFALAVPGRAGCDEKATWYNGLRAIFNNCPYESWSNGGQDDFLEKYQRCLQEHALAALDSLLADDVIAVVDGLNLVRFQEDRANSTDKKRADSSNKTTEEKEEEEEEEEVEVEDTHWTAIIVKRLRRVLRTHVFKVDVDHLIDDASSLNNSKAEMKNSVSEGRRRRNRNKYNHMVPLMMMGFVLVGSILIPMGFQFLAVLGGKALLLAKMALILSSIQGLKKIATNGVNYGLYHAPVEHGWHDRSNMEQNPHLEQLPYPLHFRS